MVYMWTKGLDPRRIAKICRLPYRKVYDHIRTRVNHTPALFGQRLMLHDHPQLPRDGRGNRRPPWKVRAAELAEFRRIQGRFPRGYLEGESTRYSFLQYQRGRYWAGQLLGSQEGYFNANAAEWLTSPKLDREESLWEQRAGDPRAFMQTYGRLPSYKRAENAEGRPYPSG